ncbi:MAG TPA: hypothetical protein PKD96_01575, partial [Candidatus Absconditabacterales bacterium]|nr:hypothetical protein [Candidatus Absconditabacterales bacterium]
MKIEKISEDEKNDEIFRLDFKKKYSQQKITGYQRQRPAVLRGLRSNLVVEEEKRDDPLMACPRGLSGGVG